MKRDLNRLATTQYDLLVVGGGIGGACIAWDATLRGLHVALVERADFGGATSSNSLKTIHGGLRYLQDGDLRLMRMMIAERRAFLRIAPHLVHPLPFILPTSGKGTRGRLALGLALKINDLISLDRNRGLEPAHQLPAGRLLSRDDCLQRLPGLDPTGVTGGALWYDGQIYNSERLLLAFLLAASSAGADLANYLEVSSFLTEGERVVGVIARDQLQEQALPIRARLVVNATGAWTDLLLGKLNGTRPAPKYNLSVAFNLVTRRLAPNCAFAVTGRPQMMAGQSEQSRLLFIVPWREFSLIGTGHLPYQGHPSAFILREETIIAFLNEINAAYPGAHLRRKDVCWIHKGFLPANGSRPANSSPDAGSVKLIRRDQICDHEAEGGPAGLLTVVGVKFTTARKAAEKTVDLAFKKLGYRPPRCHTATAPVHGGQIGHWTSFVEQETVRNPHNLEPAVIRHLLFNYGAAYHRPLQHLAQDDCWGKTVSEETPILRAEIRHAMQDEMAQKLSDIILRRTELGAAGPPRATDLSACAQIMAAELGWDQQRTRREIDEVRAIYQESTI